MSGEAFFRRAMSDHDPSQKAIVQVHHAVPLNCVSIDVQSGERSFLLGVHVFRINYVNTALSQSVYLCRAELALLAGLKAENNR